MNNTFETSIYKISSVFLKTNTVFLFFLFALRLLPTFDDKKAFLIIDIILVFVSELCYYMWIFALVYRVREKYPNQELKISKYFKLTFYFILSACLISIFFIQDQKNYFPFPMGVLHFSPVLFICVLVAAVCFP